MDLALKINERDANEDVVANWLRVDAHERTVFHCYSGDLELAQI